MGMKNISAQRKRELDERGNTRAQFIPELFTETAIAAYQRLLEKIGVERIEQPCKKIMRICDALPRGEALACLFVTLTDYWTRMREKYELVRYDRDPPKA